MTDSDASQPEQPTARPVSDAAPSSEASTDFLASLDLTSQSLVRALRVGALAYAAAWAASLAGVLLLIVFTYIEDGGDQVSWWWVLTAPGQLVAMAFGSPATASVSGADASFAFGASVSTTVPLLAVLAVALVAALRLARRDEASAPGQTVKAAVALAAVTAATFVVLTWVIALVLTFSISEDGNKITFGAGHPQLLLFALVPVAVAALLGRRPWRTWAVADSIPLAAYAAWRAVLVHLAVFSALTVPALVIWIIVDSEISVLLALPVLVANVLVYAVALGHLGALTASSLGAFVGGAGSGSDAFWLFSDGADKILWLLIPFAIIATVASGWVLHLRGGGAARTTSHWVWSAVVFAVVGGALTVLGTVSTGLGSSTGVAGDVSLGPASWFLLVFGAWGLLAELVAQLLGPSLSSSLPAAWGARLAGPAEPVSTSSQPSGALAQTTGPDAAPLDPRTKKILLGIGGLVVAGVVTLIGVSVANGLFFGPEKQVEKYFEAIEDGHAARALDLARLDYSTDERVLLTDEILAASKTKISDVTVGDARVEGDQAHVLVTYSLDGASRNHDVTLRKGGSRFVVFDDWSLVDPDLDAVEITAPESAGLEVNGQQVEVEGLEDGVSLPVFPGTYDVTATSDSRFLTFDSETVTSGDVGQVSFEASASSELLAEVEKQANQFLAGCIAKTEAAPDGCPNRTYGYDLQDVTWTLDKSPVYSVEPSYDGQWRFTTSTPGSASVKAKEPSFLDDEPAEDYTDTESITLSGTVSIDGDAATIEINGYF